MVREVNSTSVAAGEILSDKAYRYSVSEHKLSIATDEKKLELGEVQQEESFIRNTRGRSR